MSVSLPSPSPNETFWSTLRRIGRTRKGAAAIIATVIGTVYAFALTVSYFQGKLSPDMYFTKLQLDGGAITAAWMLYIGGTAYEDGNKGGMTQTVEVNPSGSTDSAAGATRIETLPDTHPSVPIDISSSDPSAPAVTPVDNPARAALRK